MTYNVKHKLTIKTLALISKIIMTSYAHIYTKISTYPVLSFSQSVNYIKLLMKTIRVVHIGSILQMNL